MIGRSVRACAYYAMFPIFVLGAALFYVALRVHIIGVRGQQRERIARLYIHRGARLLFVILRATRLVDLTVDAGSQDARGGDRGRVVVANHPSMLDAMLLLSIHPNAVCIMKRTLLRVPIISSFASLAGYIPQADAPELLTTARRVVAHGASIIIFPEGTRSPVGSLGEFRRGAARIAVEEGVPIEIFALSMDPVVLGRGAGWRSPPSKPVRYRAVRIESGQVASDTISRSSPELIRAETVRLTRAIEICLRNSLFYRGETVVSGDL